MRVLMLNGSPHKDGSTATALQEMAAVLNENGIETEIFQVGDQPVRGCTACGACSATRSCRCVYDDDAVNRVIEKLEQADGLVIGSPVYFASANGNLISLLDRVFYAGRCFAYKPACVVVSARRGGTTATYDQLNKYIGISSMLQVPSCYWNMVHGNNKEEVQQDLEGMRTMRVLGRNMAWLLKSLEAARESVPLPAREKTVRTNFIR